MSITASAVRSSPPPSVPSSPTSTSSSALPPHHLASTFPLSRIITSPLTFVSTLVQSHVTTHGIQALQNSNDWGLPSLLNQLLEQQEGQASPLSSIPSLNTTRPDLISPHTLVRFRGMVQDTGDTQFYAGIYRAIDQTTQIETVCTGKYQDVLQIPAGSIVDLHAEPTITYERLPLTVIPIPGESEWVKQTIAVTTPSTIPSPSPSPSPSSSSAKKATKRGRSDEDDSTMIDDVENKDGDDTSVVEGVKKNKPDATTTTTTTTTTNGSTIDTQAASSIHVMVYDEDMSRFRVGDVVEFIGVLSVTPDLVDEDEMGDTTTTVGSSLRIHAITHRRMEKGFPLIPAPESAAFVPIHARLSAPSAGIRASLLNYLTAVCGGDDVAAQLLLCFMTSRIHSRQHGRSIGKLALTLCAGTASHHFPHLLASLFSMLCPRVMCLSMTTTSLCQERWQPVKDYDRNQIIHGRLQAAPGTFLLLDQTHLSSGQLDNTGVLNLRTLNKLVTQQVLEYDFKYNTMDFNVDMPVLSITEKGKSLVGSDVVLDLRPTTPISEVLPSISPSQVESYRAYLLAAHSQPFELDETSAKWTEEYFVALRQRMNATEETFHFLLTIARLLTCCHLERTLSADRWKETMTLVERIFAVTTSPHQAAA